MGRACDLVARLPAGIRRRLSVGRRAAGNEHRLRRIPEWFDHAIALGASGIALGPIFARETHGYDTIDYFRIDPRLGDDEDFDYLVAEACQRGLRCCWTGCSTTSAGGSGPSAKPPTTTRHARWFRGRPRQVPHLRRPSGSAHAEPRQSRSR